MDAKTARGYARWVAALYAITMVAGGWGEVHVPNTLLVADDVAETAHRVASSMGLFRASFGAYLLEAMCDITLNVLLYALLRPVSRTLALLASCFGLMGTAVYAAGELVYFSAALPALDADVARVFSPEGKAALTYVCLTVYGYVNGIFAVFYGSAAVVRGYLILRSGFLPRALGAILMLGGASFIAKNFLAVFAPQFDLPYVLVPMFVAMVSMTLWLAIKGVDGARWDGTQAAAARAGR